jgi:hypothetical protein
MTIAGPVEADDQAQPKLRLPILPVFELTLKELADEGADPASGVPQGFEDISWTRNMLNAAQREARRFVEGGGIK